MTYGDGGGGPGAYGGGDDDSEGGSDDGDGRGMLSYFTTNSLVIFRLCMSRKMKDALEMIDELVVEMNNFHFLQHAEAPTIDHPQTHSHVNESEIVGRQNDKEQVRVKHHFELVLWVCVSHKFVIEETIRSIIEVATVEQCDLTQMEALQKELCGVLGNKRYLLVLDDVWNEDGQKWDAMRSLLNLHAGSGSAIIVTSRSNQVASIMGTLPPHQISLLNEDESWELFRRIAFGREVEKQEELISMAKCIVHKCERLPLAIKATSALLCSKNHGQWVSVMDSDVWKDDIVTTTGIVPALQLSYDHLSSEEKICFSFYAIFPKYRWMDKEMLIQLWMANDFIASETRGQEIFDVLVWRCFLLDVEIQRDNFMYQPTTCKMHDLMHDLAHHVSGNDCFILQESSSCKEILQGCTHASSLQHEVRHLTLDYISNDTIAAMKEILAPRPRTILIQDISKSLSMAKKKSMSLRALNTLSIKKNLINLKHLRYLDCSKSNISTLPEATTMLYSLQTLKLIDCKELKKLPEGMRYMSSLRHILLVGCESLSRMPRGCGIDQLKNLNLGGGLSLSELRKVHSAENAKEGNISPKHKLKRLSLDWYGNISVRSYEDEVDSNADEILEALRPHTNLESLLLISYSGAKFSSWMHNPTLLEHISELSLGYCKNCKDLPPLWQLSSLRLLSLVNNGESCMSPTPFFPKLKSMIVSDMAKLERWYQKVEGEVAVVSFPQLKRLHISECLRLETLPEGLLQQLPALEKLHITYCPNLMGAFSRGGACWNLIQAIPNKSPNLAHGLPRRPRC
ncbi:putative disease resistance protein RGA3 [Triticum dicoccoides]|uniref:putative disease resistance protein RGA3 n=1 Tax=Triticum dicoccoides TaxID=85692 RepID=UPI00188FDC6B|nr:putative disease resistance protein RGA3 [Triticum dicoccoides]